MKYISAIVAAVAAIFFGLPALAQGPIGHQFEMLSKNASEHSIIYLHSSGLRLAVNSLRKSEPGLYDSTRKLSAIAVYTVKFDKENQYSMEEVKAIETRLLQGGLKRIVHVNNKIGDHITGYARERDRRVRQVALVIAGKRELTYIMIAGDPVDIEKLDSLGGYFGIPKGLPTFFGSLATKNLNSRRDEE